MGMTGLFRRVGRDLTSTRQYLKAGATRRRLIADLRTRQADLQVAYLQIGHSGLTASLGTHLQPFAEAKDRSTQAAKADTDLTQSQQSLQQALGALAAIGQRHSQVLKEISTRRDQCQSAFSTAKAELDNAEWEARSIQQQIGRLPRRMRRQGATPRRSEST